MNFFRGRGEHSVVELEAMVQERNDLLNIFYIQDQTQLIRELLEVVETTAYFHRIVIEGFEVDIIARIETLSSDARAVLQSDSVKKFKEGEK